MNKTNIKDRFTFLAEQFDVFEPSKESISNKISLFEKDNLTPKIINKDDGEVLAIISFKVNEKREFPTINVSISSDVFSLIIAADPTENKIYVQWMLTLFSKLLKKGDDQSLLNGVRFVEEDLPLANMYLDLFEANKRKKKFYDLCKVSYVLKNVTDPTNINQYKSLAQLFDAVDPFIEKEPSAVYRVLQKFVSSGQALMPVKDRKFTLYIPKTTDASVVFSNYSSWCTATKGNGMFKNYTTTNKKPNGKNSDIYIIINNDFFEGTSKELYQIHFETNQLRDYTNDQNVSIFENVLAESEGLSNFFYEELLTMAKANDKKIENNVYSDYLIKFGFADSLVELINEDTPSIRFMTREIPKLPDLSRFKKLDELIICDASLVELHPSIGGLSLLKIMSLTGNKIKTLPKEIGRLQNLSFLNLIGNPIKDFPMEISYLDRQNGGSLGTICVQAKDIGEENLKKLKELLPTTNFA